MSWRPFTTISDISLDIGWFFKNSDGGSSCWILETLTSDVFNISITFLICVIHFLIIGVFYQVSVLIVHVKQLTITS